MTNLQFVPPAPAPLWSPSQLSKALGVRKFRFETPTYYAAIEQATLFEHEVDMLPTYRRSGYDLDAAAVLPPKNSAPFAVWITQPRYGLGIEQSIRYVDGLLRESHRRQGFLVVDEVLDQSFPARISEVPSAQQEPGSSLIRIKSFVKAIGLNGIRLAVIMHPRALRKPIVNALEMFGGAVDAYSLAAVADLAADPPRYSRMLAAANGQVRRLRARTERLVRGTMLDVNPISNGYIGSMVADLRDFGSTRIRRRESLLRHCRRVRTPIVLGASFYVANDPPSETIRLNFFLQPDEMLRGIGNILKLWG